MKSIYFLLLSIIATFLFVSCSSNESNEFNGFIDIWGFGDQTDTSVPGADAADAAVDGHSGGDEWSWGQDTQGNDKPACGLAWDSQEVLAFFSKSCLPAEVCECADADLGDVVAWAVDQAQVSVDVCVMELQDFSVSDALVRAVSRGVKVRVVLDDTYSDPLEEPAVKAITEASIEVVDDENTSKIMHAKYVIIDNKWVVISSGNFSTYDARSNANNLLVFRSSDLSSYFKDHFESLFIEKLFHKKRDSKGEIFTIGSGTVEVVFGPNYYSMTALRSIIEDSSVSLGFLIYSFTHEDVKDAFDARCNSLGIRGVFDDLQSEDNNSVAQYGWCSKADVRRSKVTGNYGFLKLHHKVLLSDIDSGDGVVVTGSTNWSYSAESSNDEVMLIVRDHPVASQFGAEFEARFKEAE